AGGGWAATRLAQPLRTASAWVEALHPAVHRAGAGLRACTTRAPCKSELQGTGTQPAAAPLTRAPSARLQSAPGGSMPTWGRRGCPVWRDATEHAGSSSPPHPRPDAAGARPRGWRMGPARGHRRDRPRGQRDDGGHRLPEARSARPVACPELPAGRHDLPATPAPAERYLRREAIGQWVRLGVEDDVPPYAPNSAPYQNFAGRLSTWSTCTCFTSVYSRMPSRPNSRP